MCEIEFFSSEGSGKTHTMLGPNPRKVGTAPPSTESVPATATAASESDGLMVKAIDEIFRHVEESDNPGSFKVPINSAPLTRSAHSGTHYIDLIDSASPTK